MDPYIIWGSGNQEKAFMYAKDCVEGLILAIEKITDGESINLGIEEIIFIKELVKKIIKKTNKYCTT